MKNRHWPVGMLMATSYLATWTNVRADCIVGNNHASDPNGPPIWSCDLECKSGGHTCQTLISGCLISENCVCTPPPPPPPPPASPEPPVAEYWERKDGVFDITPNEPCYPLCENFPASVPLSEASDFASIRTKIAQLAGREVSSVQARAYGYFFSTEPSYNPGTAGWAPVGSSEGFMVRHDVNPDGSVRVRLCRFPFGGVPELVSDQTLSPPGGTLLVRVTVGDRDLVFAFKEEAVTWEDWAAHHVARQDAWRGDFEANSTATPFAFAVARASAPCE